MKTPRPLRPARPLLALALLTQGSAAFAQGINAIDLVAAVTPLAEGAQTYCESVQPGSGSAIAQALADLQRGQADYLAWMVRQPIYLNAKQTVVEGLAHDPRAFLGSYGPESSCENLPKTLAVYRPFLERELASPQWQQIKAQGEPARR
jgi:hypothetical protein